MLIKRISILGSGYMAEALIKGIINEKPSLKEKICVINPKDKDSVKKIADRYQIKFSWKLSDLSKSDVIIFAFKPQDLSEAISMYNKFINKNQLIISILAGVSTKILQDLINKNIAIIRTMPNLAIGVGESATAYCLGDYANDEHALLVEEIFSTVGTIIKVKEEDMDVVTGVSGTGPAYIYYLIENIIEGGIKEGLSEEDAVDLTVQTLVGAAKLIKETNENPKELRKKITSSKGTTEAAVNKMDSLNFSNVVCDGVSAATKRSKELCKIIKDKVIKACS